MGLDLTAYENAVLTDMKFPTNNKAWDDFFDQGNLVHVFAYSCFPAALDGMIGGHDRHPVRSDWIGGRIYRVGGKTAQHGMPYTRWSRFRDALTWAYGSERFQDLIHFADNEGVIGMVASRRLADDFAECPAASLPSEWRRDYRKVGDLFRVAAVNGCVNFH